MLERGGLVLLICLLAACSNASDTDEAVGGAPGAAGAGGVGGGGGAGGAPVFDCPEGQKAGTAAGADNLLTPGGVAYNVRTPSDYEPTHAHPLIVVFSPRVTNATAAALETFTQLGPDATARGYVIAFVEWFDPVPVPNRLDVDTIRTDVSANWCVDDERVFYTGHSDGGSVTTLLAALHDAPVAAMAPSAAGIEAINAQAYGCDSAVPTMVIHSADDTLFPIPAHGIGAADHWASCFGCAALTPVANGCAAYSGCAEGAEVQYCETTGDHYTWHGLNQSMLDFFDRHSRASL